MLDETTVAEYRREGFHIARQLFASDEVRTLTDSFMEMNRNGPVEGSSDHVTVVE